MPSARQAKPSGPDKTWCSIRKCSSSCAMVKRARRCPRRLLARIAPRLRRQSVSSIPSKPSKSPVWISQTSRAAAILSTGIGGAIWPSCSLGQGAGQADIGDNDAVELQGSVSLGGARLESFDRVLDNSTTRVGQILEPSMQPPDLKPGRIGLVGRARAISGSLGRIG